MKRTPARPKIGQFTVSVRRERPLQNQLPSKQRGFVAPSPSCVFQDGEGIFFFPLARYFLEFVLDERLAREGLQLPSNCCDGVLDTRIAIPGRGFVREPQNETECIGKVIRCEYDR
jgi:hypothetical protein